MVVAKAVGTGPNRGGVAKTVGALPMMKGRCKDSWGLAKAVRSWLRPWGRGQGHGGKLKEEAKAVVAWPRPTGVAKSVKEWQRPWGRS